MCMSEKKKANPQADKNATGNIIPNAFIRQVSMAGSHANVPPVVAASVPLENEQNNKNPVDDEYDIEKVEEKLKDSPRRKKGQVSSVDYESVFLSRNELRNRQGLYLSKENYETLQTLVRSIRSERLSVSGLVDNIIKHHIELYADEINRIYEENSRRPIK